MCNELFIILCKIINNVQSMQSLYIANQKQRNTFIPIYLQNHVAFSKRLIQGYLLCCPNVYKLNTSYSLKTEYSISSTIAYFTITSN